MMKNGTWNIFTYSDYRKLLSDFHQLQNQSIKGSFSFRAFSKRVGFAAPNYIQQIIAGDKNLSRAASYKIAEAMKLSKKAREFFTTLVDFNQAQDDKEKTYHFEKLLTFKDYTAAQKISVDQYEYFSQWYHVAIRELVALAAFRNDPKWIAKKLQPNISPAKAEEAMRLLKHLQLIQQDDEGKWNTAHQHITTGPEAFAIGVKKFHQQMIKCGFEALNQAPALRDISSLTMSLTAEEYREVKNRIARFREEIQNYLSENNCGRGDRVCQLNYQFFHLTHSEEKKSKE